MHKFDRVLVVVTIAALAIFGFFAYELAKHDQPSTCLPNGTGCGAPAGAPN